jgi:hypothetical protein
MLPPFTQIARRVSVYFTASSGALIYCQYTPDDGVKYTETRRAVWVKGVNMRIIMCQKVGIGYVKHNGTR